MTGPAYEIRTTYRDNVPVEYRVWCWIKSRPNLDAIGAVIGRRVTRNDFRDGVLVVTL